MEKAVLGFISWKFLEPSRRMATGEVHNHLGGLASDETHQLIRIPFRVLIPPESFQDFMRISIMDSLPGSSQVSLKGRQEMLDLI